MIAYPPVKFRQWLRTLYINGKMDEFINYIGCHKATYYRWMNGLYNPNCTFIKQIEKASKLKKFNKYI